MKQYYINNGTKRGIGIIVNAISARQEVTNA